MSLKEDLPTPEPKYQEFFDKLNAGNESGTSAYQWRTSLELSELLYNLVQDLSIDPDTGILAAQYYRTAADEDCIQGSSHEAMIAAAVRTASMKHETPRPLSLIGDVLDVNKKAIQTKLSSLIPLIDYEYEPVEPEEYLEYIADQVDLTNKTECIAQAEDILAQKRDVDPSHFYSKSPIAIAAGAVYAGARFHTSITQADVAQVCDVSEVSIRNHYKPLLDTYDRFEAITIY